MKVSVIMGTRPEAIKLCPVVAALRADSAFDCRVCVSGQHCEMMHQVLDAFGVVPDADLALMQPNQTLARFTSRAIVAIDEYLEREMPDVVMVQGDTTTTFCGALAAFYHRIRVAHVEAGLRTGNLYSPWPEEANRVLATRLGRWHFAPTEISRQNLLREGVAESNVFVTGNTGIDALHIARHLVGPAFPIEGISSEVLAGNRRLVLITGHRRENFGQGFEEICRAIARCALKFPDVEFVYPVHLNPNVQEPVRRILGQAVGSNVHLIAPLGYLEFVALMMRATFVLTDSGGVQEEAPSIAKPVLVMRDTTERPEAVSAGGVRLVGAKEESICSGVSELLTNADTYAAMARARSPYGDGHAAERIVEILKRG